MEERRFSPGSYGDYSGVVFYGPPQGGFWEDRFAISNQYVVPLFSSLYLSARDGDASAPRLIVEWWNGQGWTGVSGIVEIPREDLAHLIAALARLSADELAPRCDVIGPDRCMEAAVALRKFLAEHSSRGTPVFIETE